MFVTCADLAEGCELSSLLEKAPDRNVDKALACLRSEAERVVATPTVDEAKSIEGVTGHHYKTRRPACQAFLDLGEAKQDLLARRLTLVTSSFNAGNVEDELHSRFLQTEPKRNRALVAELIIEWWDLRVAKALLEKAPRQIAKTELLERLHEIRVEITAPNLPDDFGLKEPKPAELSGEFGGNMQRQIELVDGGEHRITRAARER